MNINEENYQEHAKDEIEDAKVEEEDSLEIDNVRNN
jgi:hypothetical protein